MWQEQLHAPGLLDILLLYLGLGPCLYIKTQYLKWSILLSNKKIVQCLMSAKETYPESLREFHRIILLPHDLAPLV